MLVKYWCVIYVEPFLLVDEKEKNQAFPFILIGKEAKGCNFSSATSPSQL